MKCKKGYKKVGDKCNKRSNSKIDNSVNINNMWVFIIIFGIFVIAGILFYGGSQGWLESLSVIEDEDIIDYIEGPENNKTQCSFSMDLESINSGEIITGTIFDGGNSFCQVFSSRDGEDWVRIFGGTANQIGFISDDRVVTATGSYLFRAICDTSGDNRIGIDDCLTNSVSLEVLP